MEDKGGKRRSPVARHYQPDGIVDRQRPEADAVPEDRIEGRNAVLEAISAGRPLDKVYIAKGDIDSTLRHIASVARNAGAVVVEVDRRKLDAMSATYGAHQGVIALVAAKAYCTLDDILALARQREEAPLVVLCDEISDSHNLGAIIRSAEAAGAHGIVIPKRRSAGLTPIVVKTSAGAVNHLPVARVPNLSGAIETLKREGLWIFGASMDGKATLWETDFSGPAAIVIGSEGEGMGRLVTKNCDALVRIPMQGKMSSLNASVSAALLLYEALRQRTSK